MKTWTGNIENCQLCNGPLDGKMVDGRVYRESGWANMCLECHRQYGCGLGIGRGQYYELVNGIWMKKDG